MRLSDFTDAIMSICGALLMLFITLLCMGGLSLEIFWALRLATHG